MGEIKACRDLLGGEKACWDSRGEKQSTGGGDVFGGPEQESLGLPRPLKTSPTSEASHALLNDPHVHLMAVSGRSGSGSH